LNFCLDFCEGWWLKLNLTAIFEENNKSHEAGSAEVDEVSGKI